LTARLKPLVLALVLTTLTSAMPGCSGQASNPKSAYGRDLQVIDAALRARIASAARRTHQGHPNDRFALAAQYRQTAAGLTTAAGALAALHPPSDVLVAHDSLVRGLRDVAVAFGRAAVSATAGHVGAARALVSAIPRSPAGDRVRSATAALASHGYGLIADAP
jgi:hypothetical protein